MSSVNRDGRDLPTRPLHSPYIGQASGNSFPESTSETRPTLTSTAEATLPCLCPMRCKAQITPATSIDISVDGSLGSFGSLVKSIPNGYLLSIFRPRGVDNRRGLAQKSQWVSVVRSSLDLLQFSGGSGATESPRSHSPGAIKNSTVLHHVALLGLAHPIAALSEKGGAYV